jgi:putative ABC transport system permease protein
MKWLSRLFNRKRLDRELAAELEDHLERQVRDFVGDGLSESEARRRARLLLGGSEGIKEECREARGTARLEGVLRDIGFAWRGLRLNPGFAFTAVLTIGLAIGGASAVFSVVDRSLFRPLPYPGDERLVSIGIVAEVISLEDWMFAGTFQDWRRQVSAFEAMTAWKGVSDCDRNDGRAERLHCAMADQNFLPVLGMSPVLGRNFTAEEDQAGAEPVALISYGFWQSRLGGSAEAVGSKLTIDEKATRIIGVLPKEFETPSLMPAEILVPLKLRVGAQKQRVVQVLGRLRSGISLESARAQLEAPFQTFLQGAPADFKQAVPMRLRVAGVREQQTRKYQGAFLMLLGAVLCFVVMACANVASLVLARSESRRHEYAVRASLGASPGRLAQQTLIESLLLGVLGMALGLALGYALLAVFRWIAPAGLPRMSEATIDLRVLAFSSGLALLAALLFGSAPAWRRIQGEDYGLRFPSGRRQSWMRHALVGMQFAISLVLLSGTGLFLLSLLRLQQAPLGFSPTGVLTASFILPAQRYGSEEQQIAFFRQLEDQLRVLPGVRSVAVSDSLPPAGDPRSIPYVALVGGGDASVVKGSVKWRFVSAGYLETLSIPILKGRGFEPQDESSGEQAIVINEALAKRLFGSEDPLGKRIRFGNASRIVGVVMDVKNDGLDRPAAPEMIVLRKSQPNDVSGNQRPPYGWRLAIASVRVEGEHRLGLEALQEQIQRLEPSVAVIPTTLSGQVSQYTATPRFQASLLSLFAGIGLALAAIGLYGLTAYLVVQRRPEIGLRIALGARRRNIIALMMSEGITWTFAGMLTGLIVAMVLGKYVETLLYEVRPGEPMVLLGVVLLSLVASLVGTLAPSVSAASVDPMQVLRRE